MLVFEVFNFMRLVNDVCEDNNTRPNASPYVGFRQFPNAVANEYKIYTIYSQSYIEQRKMDIASSYPSSRALDLEDILAAPVVDADIADLTPSLPPSQHP
jgi:hypothetical protein